MKILLFIFPYIYRGKKCAENEIYRFTIYRMTRKKILKKLKRFCRSVFSWIYGLYDINMGALFLEKK